MGRDTRPITPDTLNDNDRHYFTVLSEILVSFWSIYQLTFDGSLNKQDNRTVSVPLIFSLYGKGDPNFWKFLQSGPRSNKSVHHFLTQLGIVPKGSIPMFSPQLKPKNDTSTLELKERTLIPDYLCKEHPIHIRNSTEMLQLITESNIAQSIYMIFFFNDN